VKRTVMIEVANNVGKCILRLLVEVGDSDTCGKDTVIGVFGRQ